MGMGNINISGNISGGQQNIGQTKIEGGQNQTNNYGSDKPTPEKVIATILDAVPEESKQVVDEAMEPIRAEINALAAMPIAQAEAEKQTIMQRVATATTSLASAISASGAAPKVQAAVLNFTEAGLSCIAPPVGWLIAGTLAAIRAIKG